MPQTDQKPDRMEYFRQWHLKNRARRLVRNHERYMQNRELRLKESGKYQKAHPEKVRAWAKKYASKNRELCRQRNRDWYKRNAEGEKAKSRAERKAAYASHGPEIRAKNRAWAAANKDKIRARDARRKMRVKGVALENPELIERWKNEVRAQRFARCHWCGTKVPGRQVHFDHVKALANGGIHSISNLCVACRECNCSKQARAASKWDKHAQMFLPI